MVQSLSKQKSSIRFHVAGKIAALREQRFRLLHSEKPYCDQLITNI